MAADKPFLVKADSTREMDEHRASHPLNPKAEAHYRSLSGVVGLQRLGLHMVRLAPGKEANGKRIWLVDSDRLEEWDWRKKS